MLTALLSSGAKLEWYLFKFDSPLNCFRTTALWLSVALAAVFLTAFLLAKGENKKALVKTCSGFAVVYACVVGASFLGLSFLEDGFVKILFIPLAVTVVLIAASGVAFWLSKDKKVRTICLILVGASLLATLVCMGVYYGRNFEGDGYYNSDVASVNQAVLYISAICLIAVIIALGFVFGKGGAKGIDSKSIAYAAICIAMSFALSYIRLFKLPQGGSVTVASLLPLMIYSYMFGTKKGVFAGLIYGLLQAVQDPWIIHPAQFMLDYPVAFSAIGLAGAFAKLKKMDKLPQLQFALGALFASALRFTAHVLSGVFAFGAYAADYSIPPLEYSLAYNSFVFVDIAIVIAVGVLVFSSKSFMKIVRQRQLAESSVK